MSRDWSSLIHEALAGVADDPYVRLLKDRLRSGSQIVRIHLEAAAGQQPEYVVILSLHRQLSEMRLPHSEAFTNWSLEAGARMVSEAEEAERMALLLHERFVPLLSELDPAHFVAIFVPYIRAMAPPKASEVARQLQPIGTVDGRAKKQALQQMESVLVELARVLGRALRYDEAATARILDSSLAQWMTRCFPVHAQESSLPR
ncbi:MAG TPA: hypothetical protein VF815_19815 [Myxococcaceae bacterium]|jgi:hypothetical protein